jgi:sulfonate transport system permease protein
VAAVLRRELARGELPADLAASLARDLAGFAIGAAAGLAFGMLLGLSRAADRLLAPSFDGFKQIATFAWIPLLSVWLGVGEAAKVAFVALAAFTPVVVNTCQGVRGASRELLEVGRVLRLTRRQILTRIVLPAALPSILTGVRLALIYAWLATIGAEYFMTVGPGIGGLVIEGRERFDMGLVMLGVVVLGLVGYLVGRLADAVGTRLAPWRQA